MAHKNRRPPIHLNIEKNKFNSFLNYINNVSNDENSSKLITEKLLKYSIPFKNKENFEFVEINFFIDEVRDLIYLLFNSITFDNSNYVDYYSILLKLKEKTD